MAQKPLTKEELAARRRAYDISQRVAEAVEDMILNGTEGTVVSAPELVEAFTVARQAVEVAQAS
jgi:hypothetical protein